MYEDTLSGSITGTSAPQNAKKAEPAAMNILGGQLERARERAARLNERAHSLADRAFGSTPSPAETAMPQPPQMFAGTLGMLENDLNSLHDVLAALERAFTRLDNLA